MKRVVILGCGPAGIFAAHAAVHLGLDVTIYSRKRRSEMFGAQYLHKPIPGLTMSEPIMIGYSLMGTAEQYAAKVYGDEQPEFVSPDSLVGRHAGWDIREAYYEGYARYWDRIVDVPQIDGKAFTPGHSGEQATIFQAFSQPGTQIISTIPAHLICMRKGEHVFKARSIWAIGDAPERGQIVDIPVPDGEVICNGESSPAWYRAANVFGHKTIEWPHNRKPPMAGVAEVQKVIGTNCECWQPKVWRAGRVGTWNKKALSHNAYYWTYDILQHFALRGR